MIPLYVIRIVFRDCSFTANKKTYIIVARKYICKIYKLDMKIFIRSSLAKLFIIEKITNESALAFHFSYEFS